MDFVQINYGNISNFNLKMEQYLPKFKFKGILKSLDNNPELHSVEVAFIGNIK